MAPGRASLPEAGVDGLADGGGERRGDGVGRYDERPQGAADRGATAMMDVGGRGPTFLWRGHTFA